MMGVAIAQPAPDAPASAVEPAAATPAPAAAAATPAPAASAAAPAAAAPAPATVAAVEQPPAAPLAPAAPASIAPARRGGGTLGFDPLLVMPLGDYADGIEIGGGIALRGEVSVAPQVMLTGRVGGLFHLLEEDASDVSIRMLLVYAGLRFNTSLDPNRTGFVFGEAGLNRVRVAIDFDGASFSDAENKLSFNFGAGFQTGQAELRASLFVTPSVGSSSGGDGTTLTGLMMSIGANFSEL